MKLHEPGEVHELGILLVGLGCPVVHDNGLDQHDGDFLREQKMVAPTYQELAADQVPGKQICCFLQTV